jgi:serine/threonine-protein kinase
MTNLVGQTLGQYQLIETIHDGANTVYKGFQPGMNRYVAVKVLDSTQAGNPAFVQQFQQDMQFIASLEHPGLLPVLDYGQQDEWLYLVTRHVESGTLQDRLTQGYQYNIQQAKQLIHPIADALDYLHSKGAVHGNLKPANILIDQQGQPLLTDFGYTQGIDVGQQENAYLSPEQARGEPIDRRTDFYVYALGALLYELVIGQPPPVGGGPGPRSIRPDLPVAVEQVILKAMAQYPDQRFQSAGELSNALSAALAPQAAPVPVAQPVQPAPAPAPAPQPALAAQPESKGGTNWVMILIGVAVVCLLAVICSGLFAYFGVTSQDSSESPLLVPIFIGGPTDTPGPTEPEVPPAPEEPPVPEPPPEEPPPEEPPVQEPPAEEPPAEEPPAEQPPAEEPPAQEPPAEEPPAEENQ